MKRHEALAPLSREHHETLVLAQLLKKPGLVYKGLPSQAADKARYALKHYDTQMRQHFKQEERIVEKAGRLHAVLQGWAVVIKTEHREIAALFEALLTANDAQSVMQQLAVKLEAHIRKEERELFPLLQQQCSNDLLQEVHEWLH